LKIFGIKRIAVCIGKNRFHELPVPCVRKNQRTTYFGYLKKKSVSENGQFQVFETKHQFQRTTRLRERTGKDLAV
jgi:hypothetical protein